MRNWRRWTLNKIEATFGWPFYLHKIVDFPPDFPHNPLIDNKEEKT
ncbi:hypothetical protein [Enterobacter phage vB_ExiM_F5M1E]|nr:hypothetical protein [Enterobacter phage vB_ExiM_F1M1E]UNA02971.1 hypothetical protein [Enterobacter phage vB_ExiM_F2M1E]UNA03292.1 hypothetical protein [Enterobacter phage vB_ExiM_F4M1E]UNA03612.1 hypothetical protein [Enterobacter phage vB_ExiM_F5M1E]UNA03933.1 hypothetical protein [Pantoea phage vB_PdiM_F5M2A]